MSLSITYIHSSSAAPAGLRIQNQGYQPACQPAGRPPIRAKWHSDGNVKPPFPPPCATGPLGHTRYSVTLCSAAGNGTQTMTRCSTADRREQRRGDSGGFATSFFSAGSTWKRQPAAASSRAELTEALAAAAARRWWRRRRRRRQLGGAQGMVTSQHPCKQVRRIRGGADNRRTEHGGRSTRTPAITDSKTDRDSGTGGRSRQLCRGGGGGGAAAAARVFPCGGSRDRRCALVQRLMGIKVRPRSDAHDRRRWAVWSAGTGMRSGDGHRPRKVEPIDEPSAAAPPTDR